MVTMTLTASAIEAEIETRSRRDRALYFRLVSRAVAIIPAQVNQVFLVGEF
jgi:hypothetical protein